MPTQVRVPGFTPSVNGLHFVNAFPHEPDVAVDAPPFGRIEIGDASNGLCGGMVATVCDVFATPGMAPPPDTAPPAQGSPLFRYIVARLIDSFDLPNAGFMKYYDWMLTSDHDIGWPPFFIRHGLAWKTIVEEWPATIRPELDAGRLCPLGLVTTASPDPTQLGQNHQVLAYGYDLDDTSNLSLLIYDPNTPPGSADDVRIGFSLADPSHTTPISHNVGIGHPIRGLFRAPYRFHDPNGLTPPPPVSFGPARGLAAAGILAARQLRLRVEPARIRSGVPTLVTVYATDADSGEPVRAAVQIGGAAVGTSGTPFAYTFFAPPAAAGAAGGAKPGARKTGGRMRAGAHALAPGFLPAYVELDVR
jgi:hypothetical protein